MEPLGPAPLPPTSPLLSSDKAGEENMVSAANTLSPTGWASPVLKSASPRRLRALIRGVGEIPLQSRLDLGGWKLKEGGWDEEEAGVATAALRAMSTAGGFQRTASCPDPEDVQPVPGATTTSLPSFPGKKHQAISRRASMPAMCETLNPKP